MDVTQRLGTPYTKMNKTITLTICVVLLFGILAVSVQAGDEIVEAIGVTLTKITGDITLNKKSSDRTELPSYGLDNIDYKLLCDSSTCIFTLNKANVFQDREVKFDSTYQNLVSEEVLEVRNETTGEIIVEKQPAVYETLNYTNTELQSIAQEKANQEISSALGNFKATAPQNKDKLEVTGKVKVRLV